MPTAAAEPPRLHKITVPARLCLVPWLLFGAFLGSHFWVLFWYLILVPPFESSLQEAHFWVIFWYLKLGRAWPGRGCSASVPPPRPFLFYSCMLGRALLGTGLARLRKNCEMTFGDSSDSEPRTHRGPPTQSSSEKDTRSRKKPERLSQRADAGSSPRQQRRSSHLSHQAPFQRTDSRCLHMQKGHGVWPAASNAGCASKEPTGDNVLRSLPALANPLRRCRQDADILSRPGAANHPLRWGGRLTRPPRINFAALLAPVGFTHMPCCGYTLKNADALRMESRQSRLGTEPISQRHRPVEQHALECLRPASSRTWTALHVQGLLLPMSKGPACQGCRKRCNSTSAQSPSAPCGAIRTPDLGPLGPGKDWVSCAGAEPRTGKTGAQSTASTNAPPHFGSPIAAHGQKAGFGPSLSVSCWLSGARPPFHIQASSFCFSCALASRRYGEWPATRTAHPFPQ